NKVALFYLPALTGDVFWTAAILVALGTTFGTILGIGSGISIIISAAVVIIYTSMGGLWSVAVTDVIQLTILIGGLLFVLPFIYGHGSSFQDAWNLYKDGMGSHSSFLPTKEALGNQWASWWDYAFLLMLGGIPWQVYFQRVLAARSSKVAVRLSIISGLVCLIAAIPAVLIGITGYATDWQALGLPHPPDAASILPHVIRYLTNPVVAMIGLGAIAAAVMSSADSSILSASTLTVWNVLGKNKLTDQKEVTHYIKRSVWILGIACTLVALNIQSIYDLWVLCSDFVYCLLFPALVTSLFDPKANGTGAVAGFLIALFLRLGGGEPVLGLPAFLPYPTDVGGVILVPFRTIAMVSGLLTIIIVSRLSTRSDSRSD
ncbi:MAG: sodium:solute symporter family protein, partial [Saprospiraceae bacterium]|nr:sodium:solute symporter family protein [Saprospiraceae bacterium]